MSCMEHVCMNNYCDWAAMDNRQWDKCPKCGAKVHSTFDEQFDHYPEHVYEALEEDL